MLKALLQYALFLGTISIPFVHAADFDDWLKQYANNPQQIGSYRSSTGRVVVHEIKTVPTSSRLGLTLSWAEFPAAGTSLAVADVRDYGSSYSIYEKHVPKHALAAINGGFYGNNKSGNRIPLGLVVVNSRTVNPMMKWVTGGIVLQDQNQKIFMIPVKEFRPGRTVANGLQSKPLLVEKGLVAIHGDDERFNRSALGLAKNGTIVFAGAFESFGRAVTLKEFANFLVKLKAIGGIEIETALALDGGPGAQLYFPSLHRHYGDPGENYVPNLIYVTHSESGKR
jgi:uncharacterized protein YigE (DUF2233 family)